MLLIFACQTQENIFPTHFQGHNQTHKKKSLFQNSSHLSLKQIVCKLSERLEMIYDLKEMQPLIPSIVVGRAIKTRKESHSVEGII